MKINKVFSFTLAMTVVIVVMSIAIVSALEVGYNSDEPKVVLKIPDPITFNNNTGYVNNSQYFQSYTPTTLYDYYKSLFDNVYCLLTGCSMVGNIDFGGVFDITNIDDIDWVNAIVTGSITNAGAGLILDFSTDTITSQSASNFFYGAEIGMGGLELAGDIDSHGLGTKGDGVNEFGNTKFLDASNPTEFTAIPRMDGIYGLSILAYKFVEFISATEMRFMNNAIRFFSNGNISTNGKIDANGLDINGNVVVRSSASNIPASIDFRVATLQNWNLVRKEFGNSGYDIILNYGRDKYMGNYSIQNNSNWLTNLTPQGDYYIKSNLNVGANATFQNLINLDVSILPTCGSTINGSIGRNNSGVYGCDASEVWQKLF